MQFCAFYAACCLCVYTYQFCLNFISFLVFPCKVTCILTVSLSPCSLWQMKSLSVQDFLISFCLIIFKACHKAISGPTADCQQVIIAGIEMPLPHTQQQLSASWPRKLTFPSFMAEDAAQLWLAKDRQGLAAFKKNITLLSPRQEAGKEQAQVFQCW